MREALMIGFALFSAGCFVIALLLPVADWLRARRDRNAAYGRFLHAYGHDQLRLKRFTRQKSLTGVGFIDRVIGIAGTAPFSLSRGFQPFQSVDTFWLHIDGESFVFDLDVSRDDRHPVVQTYFQLRWEVGSDTPPFEAS